MGSHNEWDRLEEVIIGTSRFARKPQVHKDQLAIEYPDVTDPNQLQIGQFPQQVIEETEEDLNAFAEALEAMGVRVLRPQPIDQTKKFGTPDWSTDGFSSFCPRDSLLVVGDKIIETPMTMRSRFLETLSYKEILLNYFDQGAHWLSAPKPRLLDSLYENQDEAEINLGNLEPIFDAANILRAGTDIFYLISNTGNEMGARWLQRTLGEAYKIHTCKHLYSGIHLDSTIALLRPGLVLLNPERVNENNLPEKLRSWDKIWCPTMVDTGFTGSRPLSSVWVGMNLFMINPQLAVVDLNQTELIRLLERSQIEVLPMRLRHSRTLGGGFHCVTLDTKRKGSLENYF